MTIRSTMVRGLVAGLWVLALAGCKKTPTTPPTLAQVEAAAAAGDADDMGERLMDLTPGLHRLTAADDATVLVAVHGFASEGKEWVAPLARLGAADSRWWRWDYKTCPTPAAEGLTAALAEVAKAPGVKAIRVVGHSYGGLIAALAARRYTGAAPLEVHVVAAPLAGTDRMNTLCGPVEPGAAPTNAVVRQWRTVHAQDGAFREMEVDPQVVDWAGADVTLLPAEWDGGRLGHNRSLTWVAEQLAGSKQVEVGE